jgi:hypothetical protein
VRGGLLLLAALGAATATALVKPTRLAAAAPALTETSTPVAPVPGKLETDDNTPFPSSTLVANATWTTARYGPPWNQFGDILATTSFDGDSLYVMINDGGTNTAQPARWRNSVARVTGSPGDIEFTPVGDSGPAKTYAEVHSDENQLGGPLGSYYANGLMAANGILYATQVNNYDWNNNAAFKGLAGIAYSTDKGKHWVSPKKPFPGPTGNLNFVQYGDNAAAPDGYVYAISTEREFNASTLLLGRARADVADVTNPARWQWAAGSRTVAGQARTTWTSAISHAVPVLGWSNHITYPRMSYDAGLRRYLLTFTYSYANHVPGVWTSGSELVVLESPTLQGPFSFVARQPYFGPSNGYDPAFPINWMSPGGTDLWMIWAANFDGCDSGLDCDGTYGFNYRQIHLSLTSSVPHAQHRRRVPAHHLPGPYTTPPAVRSRWIGDPPELD